MGGLLIIEGLGGGGGGGGKGYVLSPPSIIRGGGLAPLPPFLRLSTITVIVLEWSTLILLCGKAIKRCRQNAV